MSETGIPKCGLCPNCRLISVIGEPGTHGNQFPCEPLIEWQNKIPPKPEEAKPQIPPLHQQWLEYLRMQEMIQRRLTTYYYPRPIRMPPPGLNYMQ